MDNTACIPKSDQHQLLGGHLVPDLRVLGLSSFKPGAGLLSPGRIVRKHPQLVGGDDFASPVGTPVHATQEVMRQLQVAVAMCCSELVWAHDAQVFAELQH